MQEETRKKLEKGPHALREEEILHFWQQNKIFEKTEGVGDENFLFYDGPPFANGVPHYGHILGGTIKDTIPRYQVMRGKKLRRRWGWDCHGLPVENLTEKELGLKGKKDIEEYGIEKFNEATRISIMRDASVWEEQVPRLGRFVDMKDDYKTMDSSFTESVWWAFKNLYDKNLIYKGFKSMHLCPRCGTTLSNFEVNQGYMDITDISVYVKFALVDEPNTSLLAWTTTPWTLPGNVALAVNPEIEYVTITIKNGGEEQYVLAKERLMVIKDEYVIVSTQKGSQLIGKTYRPLFDYYVDADIANKENAWKVYGAKFVSTTDGTGIVHIAPAFGEDDLKLAQENKLPIIHHVGADGRMKKEVKDFAGLFAKPKDEKKEGIDHTDTDVVVIKHLAHSGSLFAKEKITHSYPHCWRCDTPLLNYASDSWFVEVTKFKDKLVSENEKITWVPSNIGKYRFGNWLAEARDWAISRSRYWGAPLPVWETEDKKERVILGSLDDFRRYVKKSGNTYFLMRHGEAESNVHNVTSANYRDKVHLTEKGIAEVKATAATLNDKHFDYIFASDFVRTSETAKLLAKEIGFDESKIIFDKRLEEINTGDFSGKPNPEYHNYFASIEEKFTKRPPHGENLTDLKERLMAFLYELEEKYKDKKILIITHEYAVWMLTTGAHGWSNRVSAKVKSEHDDFIHTAQMVELPFVPLPHNRHYELDFHRPYIDEAELYLDGKKLTRVPDVFDCWFESGSMPYAQDHYPFEKHNFDPEEGVGYPADFIAEGLDQTRGWFYSLIVLGTALFGRAPYKHVIVNGLVLAEDGQKMSKRLKNYPDPMEVVGKYGADALRFYLLSAPVVRGEELRFSEKGVAEVASKIIGRLLNVLSFYEMYQETPHDTLPSSPYTTLDHWILARLEEVVSQTTEAMESYELDRATRPLLLFIDDLSTWYLRRSRDRFKGEDIKDKQAALSTLHAVLFTTAKLLAPFMPFTAEYMYRQLQRTDKKESVHLETWPTLLGIVEYETLLQKMEATRSVVEKGLALRAKNGIRVRQPLQKIIIEESTADLFDGLVCEELNVKEVVREKLSGEEIKLDTVITEELKNEGNAREVMRAIQDARKEASLSPLDRITIVIEAVPYVAEAVRHYEDEIKKTTNADSISIGGGELIGGDKEFTVHIEKVS